MSQVCRICTHEDRKEIDRALVRGESMRGIVARYGTVGRMSLQRHRKQHLPELLAKGYDAERMAEADELLMDVRRLQERTLLMLQEAERAGDLRTALADTLEEPYGSALKLLEDCHELAELAGIMYRQQHQGASYRSLAAIGHKVGMDKQARSYWYRIAEVIPLSQRHAGHILSKLQDEAA